MKFDRLLVGIVIILILYLLTNAIFSFFSPSQQQELFRFFILGAPVAVILFLFPRFALVLLGIFVYFVDWLALWIKIVPREFTWFIDLILIILLVRYFLLFPRLHTRPVPMIEKWIWGLLFFMVLSTLVNQVSATTALIGLRVSLKYLLLFVVLYSMGFNNKFIKGMLYFQFIIALIQIPVTLWESTLVPWSDMEPWDLICGTFGNAGTGVLAVFLLGWIAFLVAIMIQKHRVRPLFIFIILVLSIPSFLGEAKAFFLLLIPLLFFMLRRTWTKRPGLALVVGALGFLLFITADYILVKTGYWIEGRNPVTYVTRLNEVIEEDLEGSPGQTQGRFYMMKHALIFTTSNPKAFFFGFGPGAATASFFATHESPSVVYFRNWGISSDAMSLPWMIIEYGIIGALFLIMPFYLLYRRAIILSRSDREDYRILAAAFQGLTFLYIANLFITVVLQSDQLSYFYWVTAVFVVQLSYKVETEKKSPPAPQTIAQTPAIPAVES
ncbi:hypothetical protein KKG05_11040 [bacterium]|nr:hypothetical protein [bacterium]